MRNRLLAGLERLREANERLGRIMNAVAGWLFVVCSSSLRISAFESRSSSSRPIRV